MNSLDLYDFGDPIVSQGPSSTSPEASSSSSSSSTTVTAAPQPSLNEEVTQVIGQLGRFWGGVRKQSQNAFDSARKDLGQVVSQAQKEFERLGQRSEGGETAPAAEVVGQESVDKGVAEESSSNSSTILPPEPLPADVPASSFFSRLQSSLPPNLTPTALSATLQRHLPENLQHGLNLENATADFTQLRATLTENIQRVQQGTTVQQAEKLAEQYMHKGEALFKEAGEFLKDAVKVVPPEEGDNATGVVWDGTDVWTMPTPIQTNVGRGSSRKGKDKESDVIFSVPRAAAKRTDVLLKKLKSDADAIRKDPENDDDAAVNQMWSSFSKDEVDPDGGISGEAWTKRIGEALEGHGENEDPRALASLRDQLVPTEMTNDVFWTRYFFRVHQIEREEERRKALIEGANEDDDDFTWEDEDEAEEGDGRLSHSQEANETPVNTSSSTVNTPLVPPSDSTETPTAPPTNAPSSTSQTPVCVSPRESEDSYDVVSSGNVSSTGDRAGEKKSKGGEKGDGDGDDSDWE